ncbi:MAG TPA: potassium transporter Kup [Limnobacter sp.]|uniref:potassium transporter Kup n=1 Tax=Limnobacter sp. TaxID=2003368 RepID=UPI002EDBAE71
MSTPASTAAPHSTPTHAGHQAHKQGLAALTLAAIGIVYGDIGTSPLYTVKEVFADHTGLALIDQNILGAVSTIFWALILIVTLKYVILILRADNEGEGGSLALTALASNAVRRRVKLRNTLLVLGIFGATMFYGDSVITPAISVIGAMEGLTVLNPDLSVAIVPLSLVVILGLFFVQQWGTQKIGKLFGPIIVLWFITLGVAGALQVIRTPEVLQALNPLLAIEFMFARGFHVLAAVGSVVLALTGAEALYADMGHFGKKPIRVAWIGLVFPALALNYLGQGALLMRDPRAIENPFFKLFPEYMVIPMIVLATMAAIIASQAVISGAYSMTRQAILLGYLPRMEIRYTSAAERGQIYMPSVNWALMMAVILAIVGFKSSSALASAYGIAVTLTMLITTFLTFFVVRNGWKMSPWIAFGATGFFITLDIFLVTSCAIKFFDGGWFPIVMGATLFMVMVTWKRGRSLLVSKIKDDGIVLEEFIQHIHESDVHIAQRTAIYPVANPDTVPQAFLHNMKHNQVIHEKNVLLTVEFCELPWIAEADRAVVEQVSKLFWRVRLRFGFMEQPNVPDALKSCEAFGLHIEPFEASYFLSRESVVATPGQGMALWREKLFAAMSRNAGNVSAFFKLPDGAVVELGTRIQI